MAEEGATPSPRIHTVQEMIQCDSQKDFEFSKISFVKDDENRLNYGFRVLKASDIAFPADITFYFAICYRFVFLCKDRNLPTRLMKTIKY
jgi:hypothetical protein